ncbi:Rad4-domain-containing protein [Choiromyces venosus 120613-1]|uniref:Rad4-domain-containing protein n=1 Tax=Choiromyces venosus 120613-1 TaxID=1336337 RepID=A0A3N4JEH9_9PEZI|nr:Rad4-domain-containing protein [Choiromyces venosus 120613-1]
MVERKRPASSPPLGPGQPSSRLRTLGATAISGTPSSSVASRRVHPVNLPLRSLGHVAAPTRVAGPDNGVGSATKPSATAVGGSGSGLKRSATSEPASESAVRDRAGSNSKRVRVGALPPSGVVRPQPTPAKAIESSDESDADPDSDDEDGVNWEDVDLSRQAITDFLSSAPAVKNTPAPLSITLSGKDKKPVRTVRKITRVERRIRWETHKMHLLCLLYHVSLRNRWCNSQEVKGNLSSLVTQRIRKLLIDNPSDQPFRRSQLFLEGLQALSDVWNFIHKGGDPPMNYKQFVVISERCKGSRDIGAQLFCSMLRSIGVTCRLVCSLQPLPFTFSSKEDTLMKIPADGLDKGIGYISQTWLQNFRRNVHDFRQDEPDWPVYWVEAWSIARRKWIAVDPFATMTVGKPSFIEPQLRVAGNMMSYVVGFEDDGNCTDVTRRYAHAFISKTRKVRVTGTPAGEIWWNKVMALFATGAHPDRQQLEENELRDKTLHEPIPKSVKDLKGHPLYVLERDLKRDEALKTLRKCSTLTNGSGKNRKVEPIYRREDVIKLRSIRNWLRLGRTVKPEEESKPFKYVKAVQLPGTKLRNARSGLGETEVTGMYTESQTELYVAKPLVNGKLVKNKFGNIELFVESMLPEGAVHLPQKNIDKAARLLEVDYACAITDFEYRRLGTYAVATGIVVAKEYKEAVETVHEMLVEAQDEKATEAREKKALKMWRRFYQKIRILEYVGRIPEEEEDTQHPMTMKASDSSKPVAKGVIEIVEVDNEDLGGPRSGFHPVSEELGSPENPIKKPQSLKHRLKTLLASPPHSAPATKTTDKKTAKSKSATTSTKAKPKSRKTPARKTRGRKAVIEPSEEEEAVESEDTDSNPFTGTLRGNHRSRNHKYKYNFDADTDDDDDTATSDGGGGFVKQKQENKHTLRRSTRIATAAPVKYTFGRDDDLIDNDLIEAQPGLEQEEKKKKKKQQENNKKPSGGFFVGSGDSSSELSDAPSNLSDAEYEALVGVRISKPKSAFGDKMYDSSKFFRDGSVKPHDESDDGDDEDEEEEAGDGSVQSKSPVKMFDMLDGVHDNWNLDEVDYDTNGFGPAAENENADATVNDQEIAGNDAEGHSDHNIAAAGQLSLPAGEGGETAGGFLIDDATEDTMVDSNTMHRKEQTPKGDLSPMLFEDPEDRDDPDLDWCN